MVAITVFRGCGGLSRLSFEWYSVTRVVFFIMNFTIFCPEIMDAVQVPFESDKPRTVDPWSGYYSNPAGPEPTVRRRPGCTETILTPALRGPTVFNPLRCSRRMATFHYVTNLTRIHLRDKRGTQV